MNVKELMAYLATLPGDMPVMWWEYESDIGFSVNPEVIAVWEGLNRSGDRVYTTDDRPSSSDLVPIRPVTAVRL